MTTSVQHTELTITHYHVKLHQILTSSFQISRHISYPQNNTKISLALRVKGRRNQSYVLAYKPSCVYVCGPAAYRARFHAYT